jgi:protein arginine kinase
MGLNKFIHEAMSEWMRGEGPESDIVISSRVRIARNLAGHPFPMLATTIQAEQVLADVKAIVHPMNEHRSESEKLAWIEMEDLDDLQQQVLVEKHLISPNLLKDGRKSAVLLSENEAVSVMVNEEDHLRIQCLYPGLQVKEAWQQANEIDDLLEARLDYAFDEHRGYLTSCPTNVGTGIRASVMLHLPALVMTKQMSRILTAITQVGLAVRGIYGEGSEAVGNLFQISNQITLGQTEMEIIDNLLGVVVQIIEHERAAREMLVRDSKVRIQDKVQRSYGVLSHAAIMDSKEAAGRLSDVRLGIDMKLIAGVSAGILNELMVMTQPAFLQQYFQEKLSPDERDIRRAQMIRERMQQTKSNGGASL